MLIAEKSSTPEKASSRSSKEIVAGIDGNAPQISSQEKAFSSQTSVTSLNNNKATDDKQYLKIENTTEITSIYSTKEEHESDDKSNDATKLTEPLMICEKAKSTASEDSFNPLFKNQSETIASPTEELNINSKSHTSFTTENLYDSLKVEEENLQDSSKNSSEIDIEITASNSSIKSERSTEKTKVMIPSTLLSCSSNSVTQSSADVLDDSENLPKNQDKILNSSSSEICAVVLQDSISFPVLENKESKEHTESLLLCGTTKKPELEDSPDLFIVNILSTSNDDVSVVSLHLENQQLSIDKDSSENPTENEKIKKDFLKQDNVSRSILQQENNSPPPGSFSAELNKKPDSINDSLDRLLIAATSAHDRTNNAISSHEEEFSLNDRKSSDTLTVEDCSTTTKPAKLLAPYKPMSSGLTSASLRPTSGGRCYRKESLLIADKHKQKNEDARLDSLPKRQFVLKVSKL